MVARYYLSVMDTVKTNLTSLYPTLLHSEKEHGNLHEHINNDTLLYDTKYPTSQMPMNLKNHPVVQVVPLRNHVKRRQRKCFPRRRKRSLRNDIIIGVCVPRIGNLLMRTIDGVMQCVNLVRLCIMLNAWDKNRID